MRELVAFWVAVGVLFVTVAATAGQQAECSKRACDLDRDGHGSLLGDYGVLFAAFGKVKGEAGYDPRADLDGDGAVTATDFSLLQKFCPLGQ
jgi:hypothetical protein